MSLVPSQTEFLADLGLDAEVVGPDAVLRPPGRVEGGKTIVGGTKTVNVPRLVGLAPDLVIANKEENPRDEVEAVAAQGVPVYVTDVATVDGALAMIRTVGRAGRPRHSRRRTVGRDRDGFRHGRRADTRRPLRALALIWRDPWMTVGGDTFVSDVMARGGLVNATADLDRYPALSDDEIRALAPDVILLSSEPYPFGEAHLAEVQALVPGAQVALADGEAFSWYGSRLRHTPAVLRRSPRALRAESGAA